MQCLGQSAMPERGRQPWGVAGSVLVAGNASLSACAVITLRAFAVSGQGVLTTFFILTRDLTGAFVIGEAASLVVGLGAQQVRPLLSLTRDEIVQFRPVLGFES